MEAPYSNWRGILQENYHYQISFGAHDIKSQSLRIEKVICITQLNFQLSAGIQIK